jgi:hypothetical protein
VTTHNPSSTLRRLSADVVVAFFDARLGIETPEAVSGTAEEVSDAYRSCT